MSEAQFVTFGMLYEHLYTFECYIKSVYEILAQMLEQPQITLSAHNFQATFEKVEHKLQRDKCKEILSQAKNECSAITFIARSGQKNQQVQTVLRSFVPQVYDYLEALYPYLDPLKAIVDVQSLTSIVFPIKKFILTELAKSYDIINQEIDHRDIQFLNNEFQRR